MLMQPSDVNFLPTLTSSFQYSVRHGEPSLQQSTILTVRPRELHVAMLGNLLYCSSVQTSPSLCPRQLIFRSGYDGALT